MRITFLADVEEPVFCFELYRLVFAVRKLLNDNVKTAVSSSAASWHYCKLCKRHIPAPPSANVESGHLHPALVRKLKIWSEGLKITISCSGYYDYRGVIREIYRRRRYIFDCVYHYWNCNINLRIYPLYRNCSCRSRRKHKCNRSNKTNYPQSLNPLCPLFSFYFHFDPLVRHLILL